MPHYHLHLVPRRAAGGNVFASEFDRALLPEADRFAIAERIRAALDARGRG